MLEYQYNIHDAQYAYYFFKPNERVFNVRLKIGSHYIIRFDGVGMSRAFCKHKDAFCEVMKATMYHFCADSFVREYFRSIPFAYNFSDEVSVLFQHYDDRNRIQKILTLMTSKMTLLFYQNAQQLEFDLRGKDWLFDARLIEVSQKEIMGYFLARQSFAISRYITSLCTRLGIKPTPPNIFQIASESGKPISKDQMLGVLYAQGEEREIFEFQAHKDYLQSLLGFKGES